MSHVPMLNRVIGLESRETASHGFANGGGTYLVTLSHRVTKMACLCHAETTHTNLGAHEGRYRVERWLQHTDSVGSFYGR